MSGLKGFRLLTSCYYVININHYTKDIEDYNSFLKEGYISMNNITESFNGKTLVITLF